MEKEENWYFITGVSDVDPYTRIEYDQMNDIDDSTPSEKPKPLEKPKPYISDDLYVDGAMLNIIRKYLKDKKNFKGIYIYLTARMALNKQIYEEAIKFLFKDYGYKEPKIVFYPTENYRETDVQKFGSYYEEIASIYNKYIEKYDKEVEPDHIVLNVSSGTPAFEADMMLMGVINCFTIEQVSNITDFKLLEKQIKEDTIEIEINGKKLNGDELYKELEKRNFSLRTKKGFANDIDKRLEELKRLKITEEGINKERSETVDIRKTKKIILYESIVDSIQKKDYAGLYECIMKNEKYLPYTVTVNGKKEERFDLKDKLIDLSENLYKRYIGDNEDFFKLTNDDEYDENKALKQISTDELQKKMLLFAEKYPIFEMKFDEDPKENFKKVKTLNYIIEKFNIMKVKSKRDEINDWLLISTPLLEEISKEIISVLTGIEFNDILDGDGKISNKSFEEKYCEDNKFKNKYGKEISQRVKKKIEKSNGEYFNIYVCIDILYQIVNEKNIIKREKIYDIIDKITIVNIARDTRISAAHSLTNMNKKEFEKKYEEKYDKCKNSSNSKTANKLEDIKRKSNGEDKDINLVEKQTEELIKILIELLLLKKEILKNNKDKIQTYEFKLPNLEGTNGSIFAKSLNRYETFEKEIRESLNKNIFDENKDEGLSEEKAII